MDNMPIDTDACNALSRCGPLTSNLRLHYGAVGSG